MWRSDPVRDSANPLRELFDAAVRGYAIRLACRSCGRVVIFSPHAVWHHFRRKGFSERLRDVPRRFRCGGCGRRAPEMDLVHEEPTDTTMPMPSKAEWKRELGRRR
jgi:hypothetical protein